FTAQETASGTFQGTFSLVDYGPTGVGSGVTVLAPVSYSISGLTGLGTAAAVSPGFRTALPASFTGHVRFDNFADPATSRRQYPRSAPPGHPRSSILGAAPDAAAVVPSDSSAVLAALATQGAGVNLLQYVNPWTQLTSGNLFHPASTVVSHMYTANDLAIIDTAAGIVLSHAANHLDHDIVA